MSRTFQVKTADPDICTSLELIKSSNQIDYYRFCVHFPQKQIPTPIQIDWEEDMVNILHVWHPLSGDHHAMHQWFSPTPCNSSFVAGAPILTTIGFGGTNSETVSVSDVNTPITIRFCIKDLDQQDKVGYSIEFFTLKCDALQDYCTEIRIDRRQIPYYESIMSVSGWWAECGHAIPPAPAAAEDSLYSSWYNFHQAPEQEKLLADLQLAADLGFRTVILDDGWQFDGPSSGNYSTCGEWTVAGSKFPDFKHFVDETHKLGMKLMVWFSVPFIGIDSPVCSRFSGKYLYYSDSNKCYTLDPRFPEVRSFLVETYSDFLRKYDIDGFKLDFIDSFQPGDLASEVCDEMDYPTIGEAVRKLLEDITGTLAQIKPDLLYEYRQHYVGPAINKFGNMLRVCDCAYDAQVNRIGIMNLRLLNYPIAIHSDMLLWSNREPLHLCAKQLLNILFAVPQISVILADCSAEQHALLKHFVQYWTQNRALLLHGKFRALHPELNYTFASAENDDKLIAVLYTDLPYTYEGKACDIFHNGDTDGLLIENPTDDILKAEIFNNLGASLERCSVMPHTILRLNVPVTGMVHIET